MHYARWMRHGDPLAEVREHDPAAKQAWIDAAISSATDECLVWPWGASRYGIRRRNGRNESVHVLVCEAVSGPKPDGKEVAHSCGLARCANPRHLRWATPTENHADKVGHGTNLAGDQHPNAKLTWYAVHWIRSLHATGDYSQKQLGRMFGLTGSTIGGIVNHKSWVAS
jgi:hypothetical protein